MNALLRYTITEDQIPSVFYDGELLCQLMNLYFEKTGLAAISIKKGSSGNIPNLRCVQHNTPCREGMVFAVDPIDPEISKIQPFIHIF